MVEWIFHVNAMVERWTVKDCFWEVRGDSTFGYDIFPNRHHDLHPVFLVDGGGDHRILQCFHHRCIEGVTDVVFCDL